MKKLMIAAAAMAAAFAVNADTDSGLVSSTVVGYATKDVAQDAYVLTGVQFESLDGNNKLTDLVKTTDAGTKAWNGDDNVSGWYNNAFTLLVPKASGGYDFYYYASDGWDDATETEYAGWCDMYGYIQPNVTLTTGLGVWFKGSTTANASITVAGSVVEDDSTTTSVGAGYTIIANPYPMVVDIQDVATSATAARAWNGDDNVEGWYNNAPTIMIPKATGGYDFYYYAADGWDDATETEYAGWCDMYGYIQKNITIPVTTAVWFKNDTATTVTFDK